MQANLSWLCFNQFLFFGSPLAEWPLPLASFFSFFLPTCLTSLTSHIHLCDLTFVHPFINVAGLLYIIIEEKMNSILLLRTSCSSKPISLCWLLSTCPTSSWAKTKCGLEHGVAHPTPIIHMERNNVPSLSNSLCKILTMAYSWWDYMQYLWQLLGCFAILIVLCCFDH